MGVGGIFGREDGGDACGEGSVFDSLSSASSLACEWVFDGYRGSLESDVAGLFTLPAAHGDERPSVAQSR